MPRTEVCRYAISQLHTWHGPVARCSFEGEQSSFSLNTSPDSYDVENKEESEDSTEGVNALRSIPHKDVMKMVAELNKNQEECDPKDPEFIKFQNELVEIITPDSVSAIN